MKYAPHTLYKKCTCEIRVDKYGRPLPPTSEWVRVCTCRCDDDNTQELVSENGRAYRSKFHIVLDRTTAIAEGDEIRCETPDGGIRGFGIVGMVKKTNYLTYMEIWT